MNRATRDPCAGDAEELRERLRALTEVLPFQVRVRRVGGFSAFGPAPAIPPARPGASSAQSPGGGGPALAHHTRLHLLLDDKHMLLSFTLHAVLHCQYSISLQLRHGVPV